MSEAIESQENATPRDKTPQIDNLFINDLENKVNYKINKKTRESREYLKGLAESEAKKAVEFEKNAIKESKQSPFNKILGFVCLGIGAYCALRIYLNVKNAQKAI